MPNPQKTSDTHFISRPDKPRSLLVVGHDTLAHGFGDRVYIRRRGDKVECPFCGVWRTEKECRCNTPLTLITETEIWASVLTLSLLTSNKERLFLPRAWNQGRPWISRDALKEKFFSYVKEKSNV